MIKDPSEIIEYFKYVEPSQRYINIRDEISKEENAKLIDKDRVKRDRAWSVLGHRVIGAEGFD